MIIEIHMLKSFPPTNLNRDDTGSPKTCLFGGVQRGRISSQCQKRSWRISDVFRDSPIGALGIRTRKMPQLVGEALERQDVEADYVKAAVKLLSGFGNKEGKVKTEGITTQIAFYAQPEIDALAKLFMELREQGKTAKDINGMNAADVQKTFGKQCTSPVTLDIALFGRMVTSEAFKDVDAAMQVAHAISTHKMSPESDYFTAVDDLLSDEDAGSGGAGMIGDVEYNACCYYMYACLDVDQLRTNLQDADEREAIIKAAVPAIVEAMAFVNPSGKQNTFAGHSLPEVIVVEKKTRKIPVSYANAFIDPARASAKEGLVENSVHLLAKEIDRIDEKFMLPVDSRLWLEQHDFLAPQKAEVCANFDELQKKVALLAAQ